MNIIISNSSDEPIYNQITRQVKNSILNGELKEDSPLPSIRVLAKELQISVITTKRAYEELEKEGYIVTVVGKGSFVAPQSKQMLSEARLKIIEEKLSEAVIASKLAGLNVDDVIRILKILYQED